MINKRPASFGWNTLGSISSGSAHWNCGPKGAKATSQVVAEVGSMEVSPMWYWYGSCRIEGVIERSWGSAVWEVRRHHWYSGNARKSSDAKSRHGTMCRIGIFEAARREDIVKDAASVDVKALAYLRCQGWGMTIEESSRYRVKLAWVWVTSCVRHGWQSWGGGSDKVLKTQKIVSVLESEFASVFYSYILGIRFWSKKLFNLLFFFYFLRTYSWTFYIFKKTDIELLKYLRF